MPDVSVYTAAQVRAAEEPLLAAGVPLMMRAAAALAAVVREELDRSPGPARVLVLAGSGNNGGDALFAAAALLDDPLATGTPIVELFLAGTSVHEAGLAAAAAAGARTVDAAGAAASDCAVVVDGLLGTGTSGAPVLRGAVREVVERLLPRVRDGRTRVVAVDLPSGLHPDDGTMADGLVLPADITVTFGGVKAGLVRGEGPALAGRIVLVDIGLTPQLAAMEPIGEASVFRVATASGVTET